MIKVLTESCVNCGATSYKKINYDTLECEYCGTKYREDQELSNTVRVDGTHMQMVNLMKKEAILNHHLNASSGLKRVAESLDLNYKSLLGGLV